LSAEYNSNISAVARDENKDVDCRDS